MPAADLDRADFDQAVILAGRGEAGQICRLGTARNGDAIASSLRPHETGSSLFLRCIEELFGLLEPVAPRNVGAGVRQPLARGFGYGGSFVPVARQLMIEAEYHGVRRLLEPYKLEYKVRKKGIRGFEYFWAYDRTGGRTSGPGIKSFFSDELRNISATNLSFIPRDEMMF